MSRVEDLRAARQMTQSEFAEFCGISRSSIARYEAGDKISRENAMRIADACDVSVGYVLGLEDEMSSFSDDDDIMMIREQLRRDPSMRMLFSAASKASPEHIRAAAAMLKALEPEEYDD